MRYSLAFRTKRNGRACGVVYLAVQLQLEVGLKVMRWHEQQLEGIPPPPKMPHMLVHACTRTHAHAETACMHAREDLCLRARRVEDGSAPLPPVVL